MKESTDWQVPSSGAELYETVFVPAMMAEWAPRGIALANPQPGERVLDIACGTGVLTRLVAKSIGPNGRVVARAISSHPGGLEMDEPLPLPKTLPKATQDALLVASLGSNPSVALIARTLPGDGWQRVRPTRTCSGAESLRTSLSSKVSTCQNC
jgi:hypothetical protein